MNNPLRTPADYELFIYSLPEQFKSIRQSTLTLVRLGSSLARVGGELHFEGRFLLVARERLLFERLPLAIEGYGYEVWRGEDKLFWYDSQPHANDSNLRPTHPHHKHVPPNIRHNRIPAPEMRFDRPNFPVLINEIQKLVSAAKV
jgi:hypothetical protein